MAGQQRAAAAEKVALVAKHDAVAGRLRQQLKAQKAKRKGARAPRAAPHHGARCR